jgi:TrwC relaxase
MLTISSGYDPGYLTRAVATGRENYYLSAVAEHGEPPGIWTGRGCPELGLPIGSEADNKVMERLYGAFIDPRDPEGKATLGRAPSGFAGNNDKVAARIAELLAAEPGATQERRDQIIMQAMKEQRAAVYFFDATFSVPKSVSLLHASLQVRAQQARDAGRVDEAEQWAARAQTVWDAIMAANQAMLDYLQREAGYSRAGYHSKNSGRFADAHQWVIASFAQHTSRDNDPSYTCTTPSSTGCSAKTRWRPAPATAGPGAPSTVRRSMPPNPPPPRSPSGPWPNTSPTGSRDFAGARSIAAVLHGRVQRIVGTPEPRAGASYTGRTPAIDDQDAERLARAVAAAMDERVALLGNRTAADRPVWALRYLGEVPADPVERAEWVRRAGGRGGLPRGTRIPRRDRGHRDRARTRVARAAGKLAFGLRRAADAGRKPGHRSRQRR